MFSTDAEAGAAGSHPGAKGEAVKSSRASHRWVLPAVLLGLVLSTGSGVALQPDPVGPVPPSQVVPGRFIVVLHDTVPSAAAVAQELAARHGLSVSHVYEHALKGFAAAVPAGRLGALQRDPRVAFVEADQTVHIFAQVIPTGVRRIFADDNPNIGIGGSDDLRVDVDVAVIDTGIADHPDLNVVARTDCSGGSPFKQSCKDGSGTDGNGHGTHVAGTIGALDNGIGVVGVAPGARLWSVKVLGNDGSGFISWIVAGIDWVTKNSDRIEVANMSLGCECSSSALDKAISNSVAAGIVYAVAAGNSAKDASTFSPANHPDVITVSALADFDGEPGGLTNETVTFRICTEDGDDTSACFTNFGSLIEVAAPGVLILSTWNDGGYYTISGTSMASPHVAGAAALLVSGPNKPATRAGALGIRDTIITSGNFDWTDESGDGIREPLLDVSLFVPVMVAGSGGGGTDNPPSVSITSPANGATVSGTVTVTADASDDKGVSQVEFFVDGASIGVDSDSSNGWSVSWNTTTVADGGHTLTATAADSAGQTASHTISVNVSNSGGGGGSTTSMGVFAINWSGGKNLTLTVNIRRDSDWSGTLSAGDQLVSAANVTLILQHDNGDGNFSSCNQPDTCWTFIGNTNSNGDFRAKLIGAPSGAYKAWVSALTHNSYTWDPALDTGGSNPSFFTKVTSSPK